MQTSGHRRMARSIDWKEDAQKPESRRQAVIATIRASDVIAASQARMVDSCSAPLGTVSSSQV
jgi:hypothetical protein